MLSDQDSSQKKITEAELTRKHIAGGSDLSYCISPVRGSGYPRDAGSAWRLHLFREIDDRNDVPTSFSFVDLLLRASRNPEVDVRVFHDRPRSARKGSGDLQPRSPKRSSTYRKSRHVNAFPTRRSQHSVRSERTPNGVVTASTLPVEDSNFSTAATRHTVRFKILRVHVSRWTTSTELVTLDVTPEEPFHGAYAGVRLGEAQNPESAEHERDLAARSSKFAIDRQIQ